MPSLVDPVIILNFEAADPRVGQSCVSKQLGVNPVVSDPEPVIVVGAGGHAKVVIELIIASANYRIVGLVDKNRSGATGGIPVIGTDDDLRRLRQSGIERAFVALGDNRRRLMIGRQLQKLGFEIVNAISPTAVISPSAQLGAGIAIMPAAVVNADCHIEDFAIINTGVIIDHDGQIGEASHIAPGCALAGTINVGRLAFVGTGTSVIPGISIGEEAVVGAGACLISDVPPGMLAVGVPAKILKRSNDTQNER
jgi:UDP-perosamine 4-acetyltransferase